MNLTKIVKQLWKTGWNEMKVGVICGNEVNDFIYFKLGFVNKFWTSEAETIIKYKIEEKVESETKWKKNSRWIAKGSDWSKKWGHYTSKNWKPS